MVGVTVLVAVVLAILVVVVLRRRSMPKLVLLTIIE
jgi:uncharacterized protein (TIGR03382 family)